MPPQAARAHSQKVYAVFGFEWATNNKSRPPFPDSMNCERGSRAFPNLTESRKRSKPLFCRPFGRKTGSTRPSPGHAFPECALIHRLRYHGSSMEVIAGTQVGQRIEAMRKKRDNGHGGTQIVEQTSHHVSRRVQLQVFVFSPVSMPPFRH